MRRYSQVADHMRSQSSHNTVDEEERAIYRFEPAAPSTNYLYQAPPAASMTTSDGIIADKNESIKSETTSEKDSRQQEELHIF